MTCRDCGRSYETLGGFHCTVQKSLKERDGDAPVCASFIDAVLLRTTMLECKYWKYIVVPQLQDELAQLRLAIYKEKDTENGKHDV